MRQQTDTCYHCYKVYNACSIRVCPSKQRPVCIYCCTKCSKHKKVGTGVGCELMCAFPNSFVNSNFEEIVHKEANEYLCVRGCETELDVKCKVLEWLSRGAHKTSPMSTERKNKKFQDFMLGGINNFLETEFTRDDMELIYTYLGNACSHDLTVRFVESGYDMAVIKERSKNGLH